MAKIQADRALTVFGIKGIGKTVGEQELKDHVILVDAGRIEAILPEEQWQSRPGGLAVEHWIDLEGLDLLPGFIDVHVHGSSGADVSDGTVEALRTMSYGLVKTGVTRFAATTVTLSTDKTRQSLGSIAAAMACQQTGPWGARILGAHLEGPFLSPSHKGAHDGSLMQPPILEKIEAFMDGFESTVVIITLAPECQGALESIEALAKRGYVVSLGHSGCTFAKGKEAVEAGARSITHLFNAMSGLHHRDPGLVGVGLTTDVYTELIADTIHVHPALYQLVCKAKGSERLILITDAMRGQCMRGGTYSLGGLTVIVNESGARMENGVLAGSVLTLDQALRNMTQHTDCTLTDLAKMLSTNPARLLGRSDLGEIAPGKRADLVAINASREVKRVWIDGVEHLL